MAFVKSLPKRSEKSVYPKWVDVALTEREEVEEEMKAREENMRIMRECIDDARKIITEKELKSYQTNIIELAVALFDKRASHVVYWKERRAKEKLNKEDSD